jgi:hypothetical protein
MSDQPKSPDEIRADIDLQREELAHTVDALHDTLDAKAKAAVRPVMIGAGVAVVALVGYVIWRRSR